MDHPWCSPVIRGRWPDPLSALRSSQRGGDGGKTRIVPGGQYRGAFAAGHEKRVVSDGGAGRLERCPSPCEARYLVRRRPHGGGRCGEPERVAAELRSFLPLRARQSRSPSKLGLYQSEPPPTLPHLSQFFPNLIEHLLCKSAHLRQIGIAAFLPPLIAEAQSSDNNGCKKPGTEPFAVVL